MFVLIHVQIIWRCFFWSICMFRYICLYSCDVCFDVRAVYRKMYGAVYSRLLTSDRRQVENSWKTYPAGCKSTIFVECITLHMPFIISPEQENNHELKLSLIAKCNFLNDYDSWTWLCQILKKLGAPSQLWMEHVMDLVVKINWLWLVIAFLVASCCCNKEIQRNNLPFSACLSLPQSIYRPQKPFHWHTHESHTSFDQTACLFV